MDKKTIDQLKKEIFPIYSEMLKNKSEENVCTFAIQWGKLFSKNNEKILFIGKAVNSWVHSHENMDILFGKGSERIFNRDDQMDWVVDWGESDNGQYNTRKSAFWRVVKKVSQKLVNYDNWNKHIAWSNLYKIAPFDGGNPNSRLRNEQISYCKKILQIEISIIKPTIVVFLTSGWDIDFLSYLFNKEKVKFDKTIKWDNFETKLIVSDGIKYVSTPHPQGKNEEKHVNAIINLLNK